MPGQPDVVIMVLVFQSKEIVLHPIIPNNVEAVKEIFIDCASPNKGFRMDKNCVNPFVDYFEETFGPSKMPNLFFPRIRFYLNTNRMALSE